MMKKGSCQSLLLIALTLTTCSEHGCSWKDDVAHSARAMVRDNGLVASSSDYPDSESISTARFCRRQGKLALSTYESNLADPPDQESWNGFLKTTSHGVVTSTITYGHMQSYTKKRSSTFLETVTIELFNSTGKRSTIINAQKAELIKSEQQFKMIGNVIGRGDDGFTLRTEKLTWDAFREIVSSEEVVRITTSKGDTITGTGFRSDKVFKNWIIKKPSGYCANKVVGRIAKTPRVEESPFTGIDIPSPRGRHIYP